MAALERRLTLFIPGLFGPLSASEEGAFNLELRLPALQLLFARARLVPVLGKPVEYALCGLFGVTWPEPSAPPIAALTRLSDPGTGAGGVEIWMRADPVHLSPDRNGVLLLDSSAFSLGETEAIELGAELQALFADIGGRLEVASPSQWYLALSVIPRVYTRTLTEAVGRDIHGFMPTGPDQRRWHQLINEVQMVLHGSAVNAAREARGELAVNSLWFWGSGRLPEPPERRWSHLYSDDPLARGLAIFTRTPIDGLPTGADAVLAGAPAGSDVLVAVTEGLRYSHYPDNDLWRDFIVRVEQDWLQPLLAALKSQELACLTVRTGDPVDFEIDRRALWRWWRRPKPIGRYRLASKDVKV
ncbi:MAG: hypothetical protein L0Z68_08485 [Gammaproteobacteria bacterium]|nr:hypothetical protein [Gammaproteobacteria bacterium]